MDATSQEAHLKKKLQCFLQELLRMGTVKGFKHLATYLRGKEEMVISIVNEPQTQHRVYNTDSRRNSVMEEQVADPSKSFTSQQLPYDKRSLLISLRSQMNLNLNAPKGIGLPPASPSDKESNVDSDTTLFLIAGYARYSCPYVWVRSNHQRLIRLTNDSTQEKDSPLRLKSTNKWNSHDIHIWDIIAELVKLCTYPSPLNPFEVDFDYFTTLSLQDRVIATGAMVHCLQNIVLHTQDEKVYASKVFEELQIITKLHFQALQQLVKDGGLPVLQQHIARSNPRQRSTNSGSSRYPSAGPGYQTPSYTSQTYQTQPQYGYAQY
ncbi:unnamed protein product [Mytilus edulis]|uniref:DUF7886 domain-containing protein n=1 Tax=Mytilus edulis TaxID=6550 RepID=A0A8S3QIF0_MYTED|nr:unnamed protein product [Mytilus edulis]